MNRTSAIIATAIMFSSAGAFAAPMRSSADIRMPRLMAIADTNRDGFITLDEMQKRAELRFQKLDGNHDGRISVQEAQHGTRRVTGKMRHPYRSDSRGAGRNKFR